MQLAEHKDRVNTLSEKLISVSRMKISVRVRGEWLQVPCRNGKLVVSNTFQVPNR